MLTYWIGKPVAGSGLGTPKTMIDLPNGHVEYEIDPVSGLIVKARSNDKEYGREYAHEI